MRDNGCRAVTQDRAARQALSTLVLPVGLICLAAIIPALLTLGAPSPNLSELTPKVGRVDGYGLVAWYGLERSHRALKTGEPSAGAAMRVLGYMMEGDRPIPNGQPVARFVLLPEAGNAAHPPHRFGDQMIDVRLKEGDTVRFARGSLVWAWGAWRPLPGDPKRDKPLYELQDAHAEDAGTTDIARFFR